MHSIALDFEAHFTASGPLDIPAGSALIFGEDGTLLGHVDADGETVAHRGHETAMAEALAPETTTEVDEPTEPATEPVEPATEQAEAAKQAETTEPSDQAEQAEQAEPEAS